MIIWTCCAFFLTIVLFCGASIPSERVKVPPNYLGENKGAITLLEQIKTKFPRLAKIFADGGYLEEDFHDQIQEFFPLLDNEEWSFESHLQSLKA